MSPWWSSAFLQVAAFALLALIVARLARPRAHPGWLAATLAVLLLRRALTWIGHHVLDPGQLCPALTWDWGARLLALGGTLGVLLLLRGVRLRDAGLTARQAPGSGRSAVPVATALVIAQIVIQAIFWPGQSATPEEVAYQATLPGLEEDPFYWGLLLLLLDRAFGTRWRLGGVAFGWGAVLAILLFGLVHGFGWRSTGLRIDLWSIARATAFGAGYCWLRLRTGSVVLSIAAHNLGNTLRLFV